MTEVKRTERSKTEPNHSKKQSKAKANGTEWNRNRHRHWILFAISFDACRFGVGCHVPWLSTQPANAPMWTIMALVWLWNVYMYMAWHGAARLQPHIVGETEVEIKKNVRTESIKLNECVAIVDQSKQHRREALIRKTAFLFFVAKWHMPHRDE